jgi:hypothetical protein
VALAEEADEQLLDERRLSDEYSSDFGAQMIETLAERAGLCLDGLKGRRAHLSPAGRMATK